MTLSSPVNKKFLVVVMLILAVVVVFTIAYSWVQSSRYTFSGSSITPPKPAASFSLTNQTGETVSLTNFHGKFVLIFFGFTNCTYECPLTMGYLKHMTNRLGPQADQVQVLLITTDPARDTPEVLGNYLGNFNPSFLGLTSSPETLQSVWSSYGVTVMDNGETHSSYLYLIDPHGDLIATYPLLSGVDGITADMQHLISEQ